MVMKITTWIGLLTGLAAVVSVATKDLWMEEKLGGPFERPANIEQISDQTYPITLKYENGEKSEENFRLSVELDRETNTLYVGNYTKDYNEEDWPRELEKVLAYAKHTRIHSSSKTIIIHPPEVSVSRVESRIHKVPQYGWDQKAKPYEEHENAQKMIQGGEIIIDAITGEVPIPFFRQFFKSWRKTKSEESKEKMWEIANHIREGYTATVIRSHIPKKMLGYIETAREYKVSLDTGQLDEKAKVYLLTQIILGDPSNASSGSFPNKYGELETKVVEFVLGQGEVKPLRFTGTDGNFVVFEKRGKDYIKIAFCDLGKKEKGILIEDEKEIYAFPSLSPDGSKVAVYSVEREGKEFVNKKVRVFDINTKELREILDLSSIWPENPLEWSEDGNYLFFSTRRKDRKLEEIRINLRNGKIKRRPSDGYKIIPWSNTLEEEDRNWCFLEGLTKSIPQEQLTTIQTKKLLL